MTQAEQIAKYIEDYGSITPAEAFKDLGVTKLATRISEMIRDGYRVEKELVTGKNRWGHRVSYMKYKKAV